LGNHAKGMDQRSGSTGLRDPVPASGFAEHSLDRRRFLALMGGGVAYVTLRPHLAWAKRAFRAVPLLQPWKLPDQAPSHPVDCARALIGAAVLAPSEWNSQPWRFEVDGSTIRLRVDPQRSLPVTDPDQRNMLISVGAALENLLVAARAYGLRPTVIYHPEAAPRGAIAEVTWSGGDVRRDRTLFAAITERRTNRREYDGRGIYAQNRAQLGAQVPEGFRLRWIDDRDVIRSLADVAAEAVRSRVRDSRAQAERFSWMRFGDDDARRRGDGVTVEALQVGGPARWLARHYFDPHSWFLRFGAQNAAKQTREAMRSSGALALLSVTEGGSQQWLVGGQTYERFALKATQLGIAHQPIHPPLQIPRYRAEVLRRFGATGEEPLMLVRLGHAKQPPPSVRRNVVLVSSFRNS